MNDYRQLMDEVRPGFKYGEALGDIDSDDVTIVRVVGERGDQVLLRFSESPGWWNRTDIVELIAGANAQQSLRSHLESFRGASVESAAQRALSA